MLTRRSLFASLAAAAVFAPGVVRSGILMPISAVKLPKLNYVRTVGPAAGIIDALAGTPPAGYIPCDGRMVGGLIYPDLFRAVRGREPVSHEDDWINIWHDEGHEKNVYQTVDYFKTLNAYEPETLT